MYSAKDTDTDMNILYLLEKKAPLSCKELTVILTPAGFTEKMVKKAVWSLLSKGSIVPDKQWRLLLS